MLVIHSYASCVGLIACDARFFYEVCSGCDRFLNNRFVQQRSWDTQPIVAETSDVRKRPSDYLMTVNIQRTVANLGGVGEGREQTKPVELRQCRGTHEVTTHFI